MSLRDKNFALFMTRGMSLSKWSEIGSIDREIKPYIKLAEFFHEVFIFTYGDKKDLLYSKFFPENVRIIPKPKFIPVLIYTIITPFWHMGILKNIQILKTNQMDGSWVAVIAKKLYGARLTVRCGYEWLHNIRKAKKNFLKQSFAFWVEKFAYCNADNIILTSEESRDFVMGTFDIDPSKIKIIPNYIDTNFFKPSGGEKEKNRIIFVGRLEEEKNLKNLLHSLVGLKAKLVVVGGGSMRLGLESIAKDSNIDVEFKGNLTQPQVVEELNKSEVFVLPSLYEGNPKALLEAMSVGLPCIGADVPGINSVISHMEDGVLSNPDAPSIRKALEILLGDKELCVKLGTNARRRVEVNNSFDSCINREIALYGKVE